VRVVGRGDHHRVDVSAFEQSPGIVGGEGFLAERFDLLHAFAEHLRIDIAQSDDLHVGHGPEGLQQIVTAAAEADEAEAHRLVRAIRAAGDTTAAERERHASDGREMEEISTAEGHGAILSASDD